MFLRRKLDKLVIPVLAAGIFVYASYRPRFRLRAEMPPEYMELSSQHGSKVAQENLARAYWKCAVTEIQWKYGYGHRLPADPPTDFTPALGGNRSTADSATRDRYWHRLQQAWYVPSNRTKAYEWDFSWLTGWITAAGDWLSEHFPSLQNSR